MVITKHGYSLDPEEREAHSPQYIFSKTKRMKIIFINYRGKKNSFLCFSLFRFK